MGKIHNATCRISAKTEITAESKIRRFRRAVRGVHVRPNKDGWEYFRIGSEPIQFAEKGQALQEAKKAAKTKNLPVLIHEGGHAIEVF